VEDIVNVQQLKAHIKETVEEKVALTRERREYKLATRGKVDESARRSWFWDIDGRRWEKKWDIRMALLAYGFLRGRDYKRLEPKVREGNEPSWSDIECVIEAQVDDASDDFSKADLKEWLKGAPSPFARKRDDEEKAA
jgi:hypothetical protein